MYAILFLFIDSEFLLENFRTFATIDTALFVLSIISAIFYFKKWNMITILSFKSVILANVLTEITMRAHVDLYEDIYKTIFVLFVVESFIFSDKRK